jgi:hypothetical protein
VRKGKRADVYLEVRKRRGHIFFELPANPSDFGGSHPENHL